MALSALGSQGAWWLANRPGTKPAGTVYNALVSDLAAGDFLVGARCEVASTGSTTSGLRTLTLTRSATGATTTVQWVATSSIQIIR